jgi:hypothetical protein
MNKNITLNPSVLSFNGRVVKDFKINLNIDLSELSDVSTVGASDEDAIIYDEKTRSWKAGPVPTGSLPKNIVYYGDNNSLLTNDSNYLVPSDNNSLLTNDSGYINETEVPVDGITLVYSGGKIEATGAGASPVDVIASTSAATYNIPNTIDTVFIDCTSNDITATLPDATLNPGKVLCVLRIDNTVHIGTVDSVAGQVQADSSVDAVGLSSVVFISNGTDWWIK